MVKLSDRIFKKDVCSNKYLILCYDIMRIIQKDHRAVICKENAGEIKDIYERNYIITFSYLMGRKAGYSKLLSDKFVNGEIVKKFILYPQNHDYETREEIKPGRKYYCPDFVIHTSHEKSNKKYNGQFLIMEAKTTSELEKEEFYWDLFKLNLYVEKLDYDTAVYLIVNTSISEVSAMVDEYNEKNFWYTSKIGNIQRSKKNKEHHIYFLIQESVEKQPKIYELIV